MRCTVCERMLPGTLEYFRPDKSKTHRGGLYHWCIECEKKIGDKVKGAYHDAYNAVRAEHNLPPKSSRGGGGTASGFWVVPKLAKGKCTAIEVKEVAVRSDGDGKSFFRYKKDDEKAKVKALSQAKAEAAYLLKLVGIKGSPKLNLLK